MDRKSFLKRSALLATGASLALAFPLSENVRFNRDLRKVTRSRDMMGTFVTITVMHPSGSEADDSIAAALEEMDRVSRLLSRHRGDSPVATLNRDGWIQDCPLELRGVLQRAAHFHRVSGGAFDITVEPMVSLLEARKAAGAGLPDAEALAQVSTRINGEYVQVQADTVRLGSHGMGITLDGIAKGYVVDRAAGVLRQRGIHHALINAGGDIRAIGDRNGRDPWQVGIQSPEHGSKLAGRVALSDGALATSGNYEVFFDQQKLFHHIVNPQTGRSPEALSSVTVRAVTVMDADAMSTAVFVLGRDSGMRWIESLPGAEAMVMDRNRMSTASSGWATSANSISSETEGTV